MNPFEGDFIRKELVPHEPHGPSPRGRCSDRSSSSCETGQTDPIYPSYLQNSRQRAPNQSPRGCKYPTFKVSGQKPRMLGTWTLWVCLFKQALGSQKHVK